jgi:hypothetical protein
MQLVLQKHRLRYICLPLLQYSPFLNPKPYFRRLHKDLIHMKKSFLPLAAMAATLLLASCKGNEPVNLKLALQPGSQYLYNMDMTMVMEQSAMGQNMKTEQNMIMESTYDITASSGEGQKITVTYERIAMSLKNPMTSVHYDSKDPGNSDSALSAMAGMLHKPFSMEVTSNGEITKIEGLSAIVNSMGDSTTEEGRQVRRQMAQGFNDTAIRSMMQQSLNIFPDKPVHVGDTWKKTYTMAMGPMAMKIDNDFKLISVNGNTAHLEVNAKISGGGASNTPETQNMSISLSGDQKGTMDVEVATGLVTDSKLTQNIKGDMSMMGQKMPINIRSDIHMTAKKK